MYRTETFAKLFFLVSCTGLLMYIVLAFYTFHTAYTAVSQVEKVRSRTFSSIQRFPTTENTIVDDTPQNNLKYILMWPVNDQKQTLKEAGQDVFIKHKCFKFNCYLTSNKYLLNGDYMNFEAIVFNLSAMKDWNESNLPQRRRIGQKYIFYSAKAADSGPTCDMFAEGYFNWTWTYKLNSDIRRPYIKVFHKNGTFVAPKDHVSWITKMQDLDNPKPIKFDKHNKYSLPLRKAVIIRLNTCEPNKIEFVLKLEKALKRKFLEFDIYGCSFLKCDGDCLLKKAPYCFYLVYEESFAVDYVTAEVLKGYEMGAIPIVMGATDYHKFLPDGSYINAHNKTEHAIAEMVKVIVDNPSLYSSYHDWRNYYVIRETANVEGICDLCRMLNGLKFKNKASYHNFRQWWYFGSRFEKCELNQDPSESVMISLKESDIDNYYKNLFLYKRDE